MPASSNFDWHHNLFVVAKKRKRTAPFFNVAIQLLKVILKAEVVVEKTIEYKHFVSSLLVD